MPPRSARHCEARALALWASAPKQSPGDGMRTWNNHAFSNGVEQHTWTVLHSHFFVCASHRLHPVARGLLRPAAHSHPSLAMTDGVGDEPSSAFGGRHVWPRGSTSLRGARVGIVRQCAEAIPLRWNADIGDAGIEQRSGAGRMDCFPFTFLRLCISSFAPCCQGIASPRRARPALHSQ
jgi:hypothetical protein